MLNTEGARGTPARGECGWQLTSQLRVAEQLVARVRQCLIAGPWTAIRHQKYIRLFIPKKLFSWQLDASVDF